MNRLKTSFHAIVNRPSYTFMRGIARFKVVRAVAKWIRSVFHSKALEAYLADCDRHMSQTVFVGVDRHEFAKDLETSGAAFGLKLPAELLTELLEFAKTTPCFADRETDKGFFIHDRAAADAILGKSVLVAQYFNAAANCPSIKRLLDDPLIKWVAGSFIGSIPVFVGANLWWTFPVENPSEEDRNRHAHLFHLDVDDFRFFKFFFYLTDVECGDGGHVLVLNSHHDRPKITRGDRWKLRRYSDSEIYQHYENGQIIEVCATAGSGFAENTLCVHKGLTPRKEPRLLLQLQFALFDYGVTDDNRDEQLLTLLT